MKIQMTIFGMILLMCSACSPSLTRIIANIEPGQAIIQYENGDFSEPLGIREGLNTLKSNQKIYLGSGRVELTEPLEIKGLKNIQIRGTKTSLVAKIDMPVLTFTNTEQVYLYDLLIVHEIGEWCSQNCIEFYEASDITIEKCTFDGSGYFGLALTNVQGAKIENNTFFNCEYGLAAWNSGNLMVKSNRFSKNRAKDIMVNSPSQFTNNITTENTFE